MSIVSYPCRKDTSKIVTALNFCVIDDDVDDNAAAAAAAAADDDD